MRPAFTIKAGLRPQTTRENLNLAIVSSKVLLPLKRTPFFGRYLTRLFFFSGGRKPFLVYDKKSNKSFSYSRHGQNYEHFLLPFPAFSNQSCLLIQLFLLFDIKVGPFFRLKRKNSQLSNSSFEQFQLLFPKSSYHLKLTPFYFSQSYQYFY